MIILNNREKQINMPAVIITNEFTIEPATWNGVVWSGMKNRSDSSVYAYIPIENGTAALPTDEEMAKIREQAVEKCKISIEKDLKKRYPEGYELNDVKMGSNSVLFDLKVNNESVSGCFAPGFGTYVFD